MDKETKKYLVVMSLVNGVLLGIAAGVFFLTPLRPLFPMFVALGFTFAVGCDIKKTKNYLSSFYFGIVWGLLYIYADGLFRSWGMGETANIAINTFLITAVVLIMHLIVLRNTWLNAASFAFCGLTLTTSQWGENLLAVAVAVTLGVLVGVLTDPVTALILKKKNKTE